MEVLKAFEEKIAMAVERVKNLKEEKLALEKRIKELENIIMSKDIEIEKLTTEKTTIRAQIEDMLAELEAVEL